MAGIDKESDKDFARQMFVDFDEEVGYWRDHVHSHRFFREGMQFADYEPAIKLGINVFLRSHGRTFEELKDQLHDSYQRTRHGSPLEWSEASAAASAAWQRMADRLALRISHHANRVPDPGTLTTERPRRTASIAHPQTPP